VGVGGVVGQTTPTVTESELSSVSPVSLSALTDALFVMLGQLLALTVTPMVTVAV
jgi:hypothetical protein